MVGLYGCTQPRLFTPPLRELTPETSWGFDVIWFAREILKEPLTPWQEWCVIHMLELLPKDRIPVLFPDAKPRWGQEVLRFRTVLVLVARQNGKTHLAKTLIKWGLFRKRLDHIVGAAQTKKDAFELWEEIVNDCEDNPLLRKRMRRVSRAHGFEALRSKWGAYRIAGLNRKDGRGKTVNILYLDELREHKDWEGWSALSATTLSPVIGLNVATSNAGDDSSVVLKTLRGNAIEAIENGATADAT